MRTLKIIGLIGLLAFGLLTAPPPATAQRQGREVPLPDGSGKETVQALCRSCHNTNEITNSSGYTRAGWQELIGTMIDLSGSPAQETLTAYLATYFPENTKRKAKLIGGKASISIQEWKVPTLGQRSRDPVEAPDGSIWWAGQWRNLIGRIDPKTGAMKEYPLPENSMPHSVTPDQEGNIWYMGNKNGTVGRRDPKTGKITVYKMPDPAARDPHTAVFDGGESCGSPCNRATWWAGWTPRQGT